MVEKCCFVQKENDPICVKKGKKVKHLTVNASLAFFFLSTLTLFPSDMEGKDNEKSQSLIKVLNKNWSYATPI